MELPGGYELEPLPPSPDLPGDVVVRRSVDELIDAIASDLVIHALNCVRAFGDFHIALSGGPAAEPLYMRLMVDPCYRHLPWTRTHLWLVEERRVGFDDERSAFRRIRETIVEHSGIPPEQTHPIFPLADDAAERYEAELRETLGWREKGHDRLDFALLTVGPVPGVGGATSLFSGRADHAHSPTSPEEARRDTGAPNERDRLVRRYGVSPELEEGHPGLISLTPPMLQACRFVAVMATGCGSRDTVARLTRDGASGEAAAEAERSLLPHGGELRWYLDHDACPA